MGEAILVPYAQPGAFRSVPFAELLSGQVPEQFVRGRIVLVGATAGGLGDRHDVPGAASLAGVEVQANVLNALLEDDFVREAGLLPRLAFGSVPAMALLLLFWWLKPANALLASIAMLALVILIASALLVLAGIWLPPFPGVLGIAFVYPIWGWRRLHSLDRLLVEELSRFDEADGFPATLPRQLDPPGRNAAALSSAIDALRDVKRLIADTIEGVSDPLIVTHLTGEVQFANRRAMALLDDREINADRIREWIDNPDPPEVVVNGEHVFSPRRSPLTDSTGKQRGWIVLLADITAIREAQRDREVALEFLSHDMRAPQAAIITLLQAASSPSLPADLAKRIEGHARRTLRLADDFVQLARLRSGDVTREEVDLSASLAEAMDAVWPAASAKRVRVRAAGNDREYWVLGDHHALTRALVNLLDNAVKFSPEGAEVRCTIGAIGNEPDRLISVTVEDRGPGVATNRLSRLFSRFGPVEHNGAGLSAGLGLNYVRVAAERHNGTLRHEAVEPNGARFTFAVPAAAASDVQGGRC